MARIKTDVVAVMVWGSLALFGGAAFYSCMTTKHLAISAEPSPAALPTGLPRVSAPLSAAATSLIVPDEAGARGSLKP